jgi:hypothetical protein
MGGLAIRRPRLRTPTHRAQHSRALTPTELAWLAVAPCALVTLGAVVLLGPSIGRTFLAPRGGAFWPSVQPVQAILPEPEEHGRFLVALLGPVLLVAAVIGGRARAALPTQAVRILVPLAQLVVTVALVVFLIAQRRLWYGLPYGGPLRRVYFTHATIVVAAAVAVMLVILARRSDLAHFARRLGERSGVRIACLLTAAVATITWLLTAINFDDSIGHTTYAINVTLPFTMDETYAVLDGRTPLVDFHAQYGQLWPYVAAASMSIFGASIAAYTITMASGTLLVMLAAFATLRRVVRNSLLALGLYLPFLATSFFIEVGPTQDRYAPSNLFTIFPIRYGGPYVLAWLTARHIDGASPRRPMVIFAVAGLVVLNNPEFGVSAAGATLAALLWSTPVSLRNTARIAVQAALGLIAAGALVTIGSVLRSGSPPDFGLLFEFARIDGVEGWTLLPLPAVGFHLVVFATFGAALVIATVRVLQREHDALLTAMLAWSGVFGLGAGSYFIGRSHPEVLIDLFSAWSLALGLLVVVVLRALASRPRLRVTLPELAVLFGFGLAVCSIAQVPTPWSQVARWRDRGTEEFHVYVRFPAGDHFVARGTRPGEKALIFLPLSHRTAYEHGVTNVSPWVSIESMPAVWQLHAAVAALRREHGRKVFLWRGNQWPETVRALYADGVRVAREDQAHGLLEMIDTRPAS